MIEYSSEIKKLILEINLLHTYTLLLSDEINITISDIDNGSELGKVSLSLIELAEGPIQRKILSINPEQPYMTVTLSANVKYC